MEIIGYTHSGGYALCPEHGEYGGMRDSGNETGYVYPIFDYDGSGDSETVCDVCLEVIQKGYDTCDEDEDNGDDEEDTSDSPW